MTRETRGKTIIVQGGQYGSEGKGQIAAYLARERRVWAAVRTGSINAGHTVYYKGQKFSMQILPTAWIHEGVFLILGAGCYIEPEILKKEVEMVSKALGYDVKTRLIIDKNCTWFGVEEANRAKDANRHHAMGATGKGASEGIITKMRDRGRDNATTRLFRNLVGKEYQFADTVGILNRQLMNGNNILLEGTQGAMLDFNTGPYPFVTTRMTNASAWLAEAGLPPVNVETVLVLRSYPIRVAGNSGPMFDEISWPILARRVNAKAKSNTNVNANMVVNEEAIAKFESLLLSIVTTDFPEVIESVGIDRAIQFHRWTEDEKQEHRVCLSEANARALKLLPPLVHDELAFFEKTTVTKKLRRVAEFNYEIARHAILMNAPVSIAYTFLNYDMPELTGVTDLKNVLFTSKDFLGSRGSILRCPIRYVSTERYQENVIDLHS